MPIIKEYGNSSNHKNNILFIISLIIISFVVLFSTIGSGIYSPSTKNMSLYNGLITIPKIGHIALIKDSNNKFFIL